MEHIASYEITDHLVSTRDGQIVIMAEGKRLEDERCPVRISENTLRVSPVSDIIGLLWSILPGYAIQVRGQIVPIDILRTIQQVQHIGIGGE